jgi:hypothetical protein
LRFDSNNTHKWLPVHRRHHQATLKIVKHATRSLAVFVIANTRHRAHLIAMFGLSKVLVISQVFCIQCSRFEKQELIRPFQKGQKWRNNRLRGFRLFHCTPLLRENSTSCLVSVTVIVSERYKYKNVFPAALNFCTTNLDVLTLRQHAHIAITFFAPPVPI